MGFAPAVSGDCAPFRLHSQSCYQDKEQANPLRLTGQSRIPTSTISTDGHTWAQYVRQLLSYLGKDANKRPTSPNAEAFIGQSLFSTSECPLAVHLLPTGICYFINFNRLIGAGRARSSVHRYGGFWEPLPYLPVPRGADTGCLPAEPGIYLQSQSDLPARPDATPPARDQNS